MGCESHAAPNTWDSLLSHQTAVGITQRYGSPGSIANRTLSDGQRFAQTIIDFAEQNVQLVQVSPWFADSKKAKTDLGRFIVLAGNLVREEDRRLKKSKREVRHAKQGSARPGVAAAPTASPEPASVKIVWIARFAQNLRRHSDADAAVCGQ